LGLLGAAMKRTKIIFCFFVEMQFPNDYKNTYFGIEISRFSAIPGQQTGNKVSPCETVSYFLWVTYSIGIQNVNQRKEDLSHEEVVLSCCVGFVPSRVRGRDGIRVLETRHHVQEL
jgi:hypothetical protein